MALCSSSILHAEIVQHTVITSFFCMRILLSIQKRGAERELVMLRLSRGMQTYA